MLAAALLAALTGCALTPPAGSLDAGLTGVPADYTALVAQAGSICPAITAPLLAAQIQQESGWSPTTTSPAGARGIAQFMPATWAAVGKDYDGDGAADVTNPADAIPTEGQYMCDLHAQVAALIAHGAVTGDDISLTLAAYNAGIGAVRAAHGMPAITETQNYVASILRMVPTYSPTSSTSTGQTVAPLGPRYPDSDNYGVAGAHWSSGYHTGDDFPAPCGTAVDAATPGVVTIRTDQPWAGRALVEITRADDTVTWYAHMQRINVTTGQAVTAGQQIGNVGDLGNAYGCHLHFEVHPHGGTDIDPHPWLISQGVHL
jgi:murein DD-endopeptidase MepM/ murein hydrolase activator NlpD